MEKTNNSSIIFNLATAAIAIIAMVTTCNLTKEQIEQTQDQFEILINRDSLLSVSESKVVEKQLELVRKQNRLISEQNELIHSSYKTDSVLQRIKISIARKEYELGTLRQNNLDNSNLNKFNVAIQKIFFENSLTKEGVLKLSDQQLGDWFFIVNSILEKELLNPILNKDIEMLKLFRKLIEHNRVEVMILQKTNFRNLGHVKKSKEKLYAYSRTSNDLIKIYNRINEVMGNEVYVTIGKKL